MAEPTERRSMRSRKPIVHFDDQIAQSSGRPEPARAPKAPANPLRNRLLNRLLNLLRNHLSSLRLDRSQFESKD